MAAIQNSLHLESSPSRKRSAQIPVPTIQYPAKRLKTSTNSSSAPTLGEPIPSGHSKIPPMSRDEMAGRGKAEKWFDDVNEHPKTIHFLDNDPPYYMRKTSSSDENMAANTRSGEAAQGPSRIGPTAPTHSLLAQMNAHNDSTDDFRSVIDDLTVKNNKLKNKLRKYEKLHCSHLQEEKLFEVRVHGLPAHRKRELEQTLRSFASSIDNDSRGTRERAQGQHRLGILPRPSEILYKRSSSSTSLSKPHDSGYTSMSGQTGASMIHSPDKVGMDGIGRVQTKRQAVDSYLHEIPEALAPKPSSAMSDRLKTKLVVKRLEQLFTGKGAGRSKRDHSFQQEEVSQSAARADRRRIEAGGRQVWQEGTREAHILPHDTDLQIEFTEHIPGTINRSETGNDGPRSQSIPGSQKSNSPRSPEQRPTRPLDLDLRRAQVPSDNMEYIRHLGMAASNDHPKKDPVPGDGWVYLNLLTSMAQLHTLNVTTEFTRKALSEVSAKFELSPDGSMVRWLGDSEGTKLSSDSGESDEHIHMTSSDPSQSASKRASFTELSSREDQEGASFQSSAPQAGGRRRLVNLQDPNNKSSHFQYKPLFFHAIESEESDNSGPRSDSLGSSEAHDFDTGFNSGSNGLRDREARLRGRKQDNGPIIFYNRAHFCTDLSGDLTDAQVDRSAYNRLTEHPVGCSSNPVDHGTWESDDGTKSSCPDSDSLHVGSEKTKSGRSALDLDDLKSSISDCMSIRGPVAAMEASGIGGVRPEDNFLVKVQVRHAGKKRPSPRKLSAFSKPKGSVRKVLHNVPQKSVDAFRESSRSPHAQRFIQSEILFATRTSMPPSVLPPPSYVCLPLTSSESESEGGLDDVDEDDEESHADGELSSGSNIVEHAPNHTQALPHPYPHYQKQQQQQQQQPLPHQHLQPYPHLHQYPSYPHPTATYSAEHQPPYQARDRGPLRQYLSSSSSEQPTSNEIGSDSSSSIDLLAHARELNPELVAMREREFERNAASTTAASSAIHRQTSNRSRIRDRKTSHMGKDTSGSDSVDVSLSVVDDEDEDGVGNVNVNDSLPVSIPTASSAAMAGGESVGESLVLGPKSTLRTAGTGISVGDRDGRLDASAKLGMRGTNGVADSDVDSMSVDRNSE